MINNIRFKIIAGKINKKFHDLHDFCTKNARLHNKTTRSRPGRGQNLEAEAETEAKILASRSLWPRGLNITADIAERWKLSAVFEPPCISSPPNVITVTCYPYWTPWQLMEKLRSDRKLWCVLKCQHTPSIPQLKSGWQRLASVGNVHRWNANTCIETRLRRVIGVSWLRTMTHGVIIQC